MASGVKKTASGVYFGTGAALAIEADKVGFYPRYVKIFRLTTALSVVEHVAESMTDGTSFVQPAAGGATALTANCVTPSATGFSLGTSAHCNNSGDKYAYFASE